MDISRLLDLANHHTNSTEADIRVVCEKVLKYGFNAAFVNPCYVAFCREILRDKSKVGTVVSFPLGQETLNIKLASARAALTDGADELDICLNIGYIKEARWDKSVEEMKEIVLAVQEIGPTKIIKFIPEVAYLTDEEIKKMAQLILESGADFFKTGSGSIGGAPRGPRVEDIVLIRSVVGDKLKIKVTGGISTYGEAMEFINAGVDRIGTSHAVEIVTGEQSAGGGKGGE